MFGSNDVCLMLCMQVIHELDEKKDHPTLSKRARNAISDISQSLDADKRHELDTAVSVFQYEIRESEFNDTLSPDSKDDRIVHTVLKYISDNPSDVVRVCTEDLGMKLRCKAHGLTVVEIDKGFRLETPGSSLEKANKSLASELDRLKNILPRISVLLHHLGEDESLNDDHMTLRILTKPDPIDIESRLIKEKKELSINSSQVVSAILHVSQSQIDEYAKKLDDYLVKFNDY